MNASPLASAPPRVDHRAMSVELRARVEQAAERAADLARECERAERGHQRTSPGLALVFAARAQVYAARSVAERHRLVAATAYEHERAVPIPYPAEEG